VQMTAEQIEAEAKLAESKGFVRVPENCAGLYGKTFVYREGDQDFSKWNGSITSLAGEISYPIYVRKEHVHLLLAGGYTSAPAAYIYAFQHKAELACGS
jgi:hypothetical protein